VKVNNIFESIQGEGLMQGQPVLFIRLAGCNRNCAWCDTKYHTEFTEYTPQQLATKIITIDKPVVWTGGEPLLQYGDIWEANRLVIEQGTHSIYNYVETNGDLVVSNNWHVLSCTFEHITISPKNLETTKRVKEYYERHRTIKVVTDLKGVNMDLIEYADMLMPLTVPDKEETNEIRQRVWEYCSKYNLFYSARLHVDVWGFESRGV